MAALVAALGSTMVFLYVRSADNRALASAAPVQVLQAVAQINPGETLEAAQAAGKLELGEVPSKDVLPGAVNTIDGLGTLTALSPIYPKEQIISAKFGTPGQQDLLTVPDGKIAISVTLSDTGRVAGFVSPGDDVAIFLNGDIGGGQQGVRLLLPSVQVVAIGATTVISTTTTNPAGAQTTEQLPKTLFTLAVEQDEAERIMLASTTGALTFGYLNDKSKVKPGPGVTSDNLFR
ncbi:Flp pilus assembly protein CpaB [Nocardioides mesophilus]|uniref:Flp pilus assembly protein CpaB n=1 Tax=Nocardioides mesophilus TaxID=433659 RepID=A0A7G9RC32_9ACTN|nr:Flp pilus assembly protein CpaB [Nocardioides mesophilus]QNN53157.1 Flp pilus assembly protein CpaB [Nocardioides mesophilus]